MIRFERGPYGAGLVWRLEADQTLVTYQLEYLVRSQPAFLVPACVRYRNSAREYYLDVTGLIPFDTLDQADGSAGFASEVGRRRLLAILDAVLEAEDHLLPICQIEWRPSFIYWDEQAERMRLVFYPLKPWSGDPDSTPENLMTLLGKAYHLDPATIQAWLSVWQTTGPAGLRTALAGSGESDASASDTDADADETGRFPLDQGYRQLPGQKPIRDRRRSGGGMSGRQIWLLLAHLAVSAAGIWQLVWTGPGTPAEAADADGRLLNPRYLAILVSSLVLLTYDLRLIWLQRLPSVNATTVIQKAASKVEAIRVAAFRAADDQETDAGFVSESENNQTVLLASRSDHFRLAMLSSGLPGTPAESEGLRAYILIDEFIIGRDEKSADLHLTAAGIGRQHARIQRREGAFFLSDLGSKNGTSLDGRRLNKNEEYILPDRCRIAFADQAFYFQVD